MAKTEQAFVLAFVPHSPESVSGFDAQTRVAETRNLEPETRNPNQRSEKRGYASKHASPRPLTAPCLR